MIYIIVLLFGSFAWYTPGAWKPIGYHFIVMLLIGILGWAEFGAAIHK
jgi:hypothetical protein